MSVPLSDAFKQASDVDSKKFPKTPENDDLLILYALFKIGKGDEPKKPGMFDLTGKFKYEKWVEMKQKEEYNTPEKAQAAYVKEVQRIAQKLNGSADAATS